MTESRARGSLVVKRVLDVTLAGSGLIALSPLIALVSVAIRATMGSPVFFRQLRPGHHGRPFVVVKFRSMNDATDEGGKLLPADQRLTRLGVFLRRTSIDELPELWNVLKGEMSLVGPRPLLMEYLPRYSPEQFRRHDVKPGITGLAQIKGRHGVGWDDRFGIDVWYVDHWTLRLDLRIILSTLGVLLHGQGRPLPHSEGYDFLGTEAPAPSREPEEGATP